MGNDGFASMAVSFNVYFLWAIFLIKFINSHHKLYDTLMLGICFSIECANLDRMCGTFARVKRRWLMDCQNLLHAIVVIPLVICTLLACGETEDTSSVALSETVIEEDTSAFSGHVVEVPVRLRMWIRAKIVFADSTPLANKAVDLNIRVLDLHADNVVGGIQGSVQTDAQGYFVQYVERNKATRYRVSVEYKGLCATSKIFVVKVGERREDLILELPGPPR